jgi:hypothetical protein
VDVPGRGFHVAGKFPRAQLQRGDHDVVVLTVFVADRRLGRLDQAGHLGNDGAEGPGALRDPGHRSHNVVGPQRQVGRQGPGKCGEVAGGAEHHRAANYLSHGGVRRLSLRNRGVAGRSPRMGAGQLQKDRVILLGHGHHFFPRCWTASDA